VKRNGFYANGRQRWFCHSCQKSFHWSNKANKQQRERIWFKKWMIEGYAVRQLSQQSHYSSAKLYRIVNFWLSSPPASDNSSLAKHRFLIFDGTFLHRPISIATLMDALGHTIIHGQYGVSENSEPQLLTFFKPFKERHLCPKSCTIDGNPQVIRVLKKLWPKIIIQRCLVHIQRQGLMWCRRNPKRTEAKRLRNIFLQVSNIRTSRDKNCFLKQASLWEQQYGKKIKEQPETGKVFSDIKRARSMLLKALPNMFHYLDNPHIPATTNGLEGYFSRLKAHYRNHRGLQRAKRNNYFNWYFYLRQR